LFLRPNFFSELSSPRPLVSYKRQISRRFETSGKTVVVCILILRRDTFADLYMGCGEVNDSELNVSKHSPNLIYSQFFCGHSSDLLLPFASYERNAKFLGFIRGSDILILS
jgi:hypothetical protein